MVDNIFTSFTKIQLAKYRDEYMSEFLDKENFEAATENMTFLCLIYLSQCIHYNQKLSSWGMPTLDKCYEGFRNKLTTIRNTKFFANTQQHPDHDQDRIG